MPPSPAVQTPSLSATDGIHQLPVLSDNIVWIWVRMHQAVVVDPAVAEPTRRRGISYAVFCLKKKK